MSIAMKQPLPSWFIDTGATHHLTGDRSLFYEYIEYGTRQECSGIGSGIVIQGQGTIFLKVLGDKSRTIKLGNVRYSPAAKVNFFSLSQISEVV